MGRNYAALPHEYLEEMEALSDAEFGRLARALLKYSITGEVMAFSGNERFYAKRVMNQEDRFKSSYDDLSEKRKEAGKKGANSRWQPIANDGKVWQDMANDGNAIASDSKNGYTETNTNTKAIKKKDTPISPRKKNDPPSDDPETKAQIEEVIAYLNEKAGTHYRNAEGSMKHIRARLRENYTVEDCKTVIDKKCKEWIGTEYETYLRPETLFGSKFEGYLNAPVSKYKNYKRKDILPEYYNSEPNRGESSEPLTPEELERATQLLKSRGKGKETNE